MHMCASQTHTCVTSLEAYLQPLGSQVAYRTRWTFAVLNTARLNGLTQIAHLLAWPYYLTRRTDGKVGFVKLGDVLLAVTGAEATYADMGHFGKWPVRIGWLAVCYPCLVFQYLGMISHICHARVSHRGVRA